MCNVVPRTSLALIAALVSFGAAAHDTRNLVYRERVEIYWNDFYAHKLTGGSSPKIAIVGEGKTVVFSGIVNLNCENGLFSWDTWDGYGVGYEDEPDIPTQVLTSVFVRYCED